MKKPSAITFLVDEKKVRQSLAVITGEVLTDDEMNEKFFSNPIDFDTDELGLDADNMILAFTALIADARLNCKS